VVAKELAFLADFMTDGTILSALARRVEVAITLLRRTDGREPNPAAPSVRAEDADRDPPSRGRGGTGSAPTTPIRSLGSPSTGRGRWLMKPLDLTSSPEALRWLAELRTQSDDLRGRRGRGWPPKGGANDRCFQPGARVLA
jgi:hypothetical protein